MAERFRPSVDPDDLQPAEDATPASRRVVPALHEVVTIGPPVVRRRSAWLIVPSGWMLVICLFLPVLKVCDRGDTIPALVLPWVWPLYLGGVLIACAAAAARSHSQRGHGAALFWMVRGCAAVVCVLAVKAVIDGEVAAAIVLVIAVAFVVATWRAPTEVAIVSVSVLVASLVALWGLVLASDPKAVWGAYVTVVAAGGLLLGTLWWWGEACVGWWRIRHGRSGP